MPQNATFLSFYLVDNQLFSNSETLVIYFCKQRNESPIIKGLNNSNEVMCSLFIKLAQH